MVVIPVEIMIASVSSWCLAENHIVSASRLSWYGYDLGSLDVQCITPILGETRRSSLPWILQAKGPNVQCPCSREGSEVWSSVGWKCCLDVSNSTSGSCGRSLLSSRRARAGRFAEVCETDKTVEARAPLVCNFGTTLTSSSLPAFRRQIGTAGRQLKLQCISRTGGENAAMETSYGPNAGHTETESPTSVDTTNPTSLPGIIYPPITTIGKSTNIVWQECMVRREEKQKLLEQKGCVIWITGLSGSGKSTLACTLDHALLNRGKLSYVLDGDNVRHGLNKNLGFSAEDRAENIRRVGEVAKLFVDAGIICIASVISPYRKDRDACRHLVMPGEFIEVHMNFPLSLCEERDPKGLYKLARAGKIKGFTGVDDPYEAPLNCEIVMEPIDGHCPTPAEMADFLIAYLEQRGFLEPSWK